MLKAMKTKPAKKYGHRYPWREWFAAGSFSLTQGFEYDCQTYAMAGMVRNAAVKLGHGVTVKIVNNSRIEVMVLRVPRRNRGRYAVAQNRSKNGSR